MTQKLALCLGQRPFAPNFVPTPDMVSVSSFIAKQLLVTNECYNSKLKPTFLAGNLLNDDDFYYCINKFPSGTLNDRLISTVSSFKQVILHALPNQKLVPAPVVVPAPVQAPIPVVEPLSG